MTDSLPQAVLEAADVSAVTQLILRERVSRDLGLWEQMRDCFHDDSVVLARTFPTCTRAREKNALIACSRSYLRSPTSRAPIRSRCSSSAIAWIRGNGRFLSSLRANTAIASSMM